MDQNEMENRFNIKNIINFNHYLIYLFTRRIIIKLYR